MFKQNDYVMYGITGVCEIVDITVPDFAKSGEKYYCLESIIDRSVKAYVPVSKEDANMRKCISKDTAMKYVDMMKELDPIWIDDSRQRAKTFNEYLKQGDYVMWMRMAKGLYRKKKETISQNKHLSQTDKDIFKRTEKLMFGEMAFALGMDRVNVKSFINDKLH